MENKETIFFRLFRDACKVINSSQNLADVLNLITENVISILNVKACTVFFWDREQRILEVITTHGLSESYLKKGPIDADISITDTLKGKSILIYDTANDHRIEYPDEAQKEGIASILSVPISVRNKTIGVLRIYTSERRNFSEDDSEDDFEFITCVADMAGIAIDNSRMYDQIKAYRENTIDEVYREID
jgi:signal transduction protein with GAF and PtsI domain